MMELRRLLPRAWCWWAFKQERELNLWSRKFPCCKESVPASLTYSCSELHIQCFSVDSYHYQHSLDWSVRKRELLTWTLPWLKFTFSTPTVPWKIHSTNWKCPSEMPCLQEPWTPSWNDWKRLPLHLLVDDKEVCGITIIVRFINELKSTGKMSYTFFKTVEDVNSLALSESKGQVAGRVGYLYLGASPGD